MWELLLSPKSAKFLNKCNPLLKKIILKKLEKLKTTPFHYLEHLEKENYYKFRAGEYRALIDVNFKNKQIKIQVLSHRKNAYKNMRRDINL